ncbi:acyltransferase, partial [Arthrobacter deserti]|nr:acyltransferase [Arthrobacter deserti]
MQNWLLAANSADYSASAEPATALQHFWSLAVEEQFYVLWPLLVLPAAALARRTGTAPVRRAVPLLAAATAASLAFGIWFTATGNPAAYFITPVRIWELGLGGLLAAVPAAAGRRPFLRSLMAAAGLAAIVAAAFLFSARTPFPGAAALVPVLGTAAVIAAGQTAGPLSVQPLVNLKAVQWTGNISYSLYLWHWPLIVFFKDLTGSGPGPLQSLALLAGSVALAALSFHFVENPVRRSGWLAAAAWRPLAGAAGGTAVVASLCLVPAGLHEQVLAGRAGQVRQLLAEPPAKFGAAAMASRADQTFVGQDRVIVPDPANARADRSPLGDCAAAVEDPATPECSLGHRDGRYTLALVGDSHAAHWFAALEPVAK